MNSQIKEKVKLLVFFLLYVVLIVLAARLALKGLDEDVTKSSITILSIVLIFLCSSSKTFRFIFICSFLVAFYAPVGFQYGGPTFQAVSSFLATDIKESLEFLLLIPIKNYLKAAAIPLSLFVAYELANYAQIRPWRNKTLTFLSFFIMLVLSKPTAFFSILDNSLNEINKQKEELNKLITHDSWGEDTVYKGVAKDYVLVIGESVRRDYMHTYGYPLSNTPFIESCPAVIVDGLSSAGSYTIDSLRLMLTLSDKSNRQPDFSRNIIDLANKAGIETFWFSNQGYIGSHDTPISAIGNRSKHVVFLNKSSFDTVHYSDMSLLPVLIENVQRPSHDARLFVLHLMGSHPDACERIKGMKDPYQHNDGSKEYIACYASSIRYTDEFLGKIYAFMNDRKQLTGRPFSILYFADHGLAHIEKDGKVILSNLALSKRHFDVPLFKIDSEDTKPRLIHSKKSGLSFTEGLAHWLMITNPQLSEYDLFDGHSDQFDYGLSDKIKAIKHPLDPAIDISEGLIKSE